MLLMLPSVSIYMSLNDPIWFYMWLLDFLALLTLKASCCGTGMSGLPNGFLIFGSSKTWKKFNSSHVFVISFFMFFSAKLMTLFSLCENSTWKRPSVVGAQSFLFSISALPLADPGSLALCPHFGRASHREHLSSWKLENTQKNQKTCCSAERTFPQIDLAFKSRGGWSRNFWVYRGVI